MADLIYERETAVFNKKREEYLNKVEKCLRDGDGLMAEYYLNAGRRLKSLQLACLQNRIIEIELKLNGVVPLF